MLEFAGANFFGKQVLVHLNLTKTKREGVPVYSILDAKTRLVIAHARNVILGDAQCRISKAGQQRARNEGQRNVHAFVAGTLLNPELVNPTVLPVEPLYYNPFKVDTFVFKDTTIPADRGKWAVLGPKGAALSREVA